MSMCRARAAWRTHASAWNGCCSILSGALAAVERLAPHAIPAGPGTDGAGLGPHLPGELFETGSTIPYASAAVARV